MSAETSSDPTPMEADDITELSVPTGHQDVSFTLRNAPTAGEASFSIGAASYEPPHTRGKPNTAQEYIGLVDGNNNPWTDDTTLAVHGLESNKESLVGELKTIPEERPDSSLSSFGRPSTEAASARDYGSILSVGDSTEDSSPSQHTLPNLTNSSELTEKVSPVAFLLLVESNKMLAPLSEHDLSRIEGLAESFEAAQSYDDAYKLRRFVLLQGIARYGRERESRSPWETRVLHVVRTASTVTAYKEAAAHVKRAWAHCPELLTACHEVGCLQESFLGSMFRARNDTRSAERHCRRALDRIRLDGPEELTGALTPPEHEASWLVILANLLLVWEDAHTSSGNLHMETYLRVFGRWSDFESSDLVPEMEPPSELCSAFGWCVDVLSEDDFWKTFLTVPDEMWLSAANGQELGNFENSLLSCYLWSQMYTGDQRFPESPRTFSPRSLLHCLEDFAQGPGFSIAEIVSVMATMILATEYNGNEIGSKSTLARRALKGAQLIQASPRLRTSRAFLESYAKTLRKKGNQFPSESYAKVAQQTIRDFIERTFQLELAVSALCDPRLRHRSSQGSMVPSFTATMLSTPRSSWSGFRSFKAVGRRASKLWTDNNSSAGDWQSLLSSHRWSKTGSIKSADFLQSTPSLSEDITMEDGID